MNQRRTLNDAKGYYSFCLLSQQDSKTRH